MEQAVSTDILTGETIYRWHIYADGRKLVCWAPSEKAAVAKAVRKLGPVVTKATPAPELLDDRV